MLSVIPSLFIGNRALIHTVAQIHTRDDLSVIILAHAPKRDETISYTSCVHLARYGYVKAFAFELNE